MVSWKTPPAVLTSFNKSAWHYFEAPWLLRRNDTYYMSYMMEYNTCPGNGGQRLPNLNCSWSHGGFDIGYSTAPASAAGNPLAAPWQPKGTALSGSISTVLTVLSWICVGIHSRGALPCPVCA